MATTTAVPRKPQQQEAAPRADPCYVEVDIHNARSHRADYYSSGTWVGWMYMYMHTTHTTRRSTSIDGAPIH